MEKSLVRPDDGREGDQSESEYAPLIEPSLCDGFFMQKGLVHLYRAWKLVRLNLNTIRHRIFESQFEEDLQQV